MNLPQIEKRSYKPIPVSHRLFVLRKLKLGRNYVGGALHREITSLLQNWNTFFYEKAKKCLATTWYSFTLLTHIETVKVENLPRNPPKSTRHGKQVPFFWQNNMCRLNAHLLHDHIQQVCTFDTHSIHRCQEAQMGLPCKWEKPVQTFAGCFLVVPKSS